MFCRSSVLSVVVLGSMLVGPLNAADSGPAADTAVAAFQTFAVTGDVQGTATDFTLSREGRPTLYCFVPRDRWSRPAARLLKKLDADISSVTDGEVVAVFLDDDVAEVKNYLPLCQQSLQFNNTALTVFEDNASGPPEWGINTDVELTIVATREGKVVKSFVVDSPNETLAAEILATLKP